MKAEITYTKTEPNTLGLVKGYSKVRLTLPTNLVGSVGIGYGDEVVNISLEDIDQLINLKACIENAIEKIKEDKAEAINHGQKYVGDIFLSHGSRSRSIYDLN